MGRVAIAVLALVLARAAAADECRPLPSGRSVRIPEYATVTSTSDEDIVSIQYADKDPVRYFQVDVSSQRAVSCANDVVDASFREISRDLPFGNDYARFWAASNDDVLACLPVGDGSVRVRVMLMGAMELDDLEILSITQAVADALVRGDCAASAPTAPATVAPTPITDAPSSEVIAPRGDTPASELAMKDPFEHLRVAIGFDAALASGQAVGDAASGSIEVLGRKANDLGGGITVRGGRVLAGAWSVGASGWFGPLGASGRNVFGAFTGVSYDAISGGVLSVFALHGRLLYGRRLGAQSALELSLDGAWELGGDADAAYPSGAPSVPFADTAELDATLSRGLYSIGVDYRELLGGRFLGVALGFGIGLGM